MPECAAPHDLTGPYCVRLWRPRRKETLSLGHSSFSFITNIAAHSEGVNYACCIIFIFAIIDAASFAQRRRSWDLGHSDLGPQWCARSGNKSAFFAVVVAIVSRLKTGLPKWAIWAPASTFRRLVLRSGASHVLDSVGLQPAPASISFMHKRS